MTRAEAGDQYAASGRA